MIRDAVAVRLSPEERAVLEAKLRAPTTEQRQVFRARIVLLAAEERSTLSIARELGTMPRTVSGWRGRFAREGLAGLEDRPHPGPAPKYDSATGRRILALLDEPPPSPTFSTGEVKGAERSINGAFGLKGLHYILRCALASWPAAVMRGGGCGGKVRR